VVEAEQFEVSYLLDGVAPRIHREQEHADAHVAEP
jgi:hypothetical protein